MHYETVVNATIKHGERVTTLVVRREPWWTNALFMAADLLCAATFHRIGCDRIVGPAFDVVERHTEEWVLPIPVDTAAGFLRWRGREVWWEDTDE